MLAPHEPSGEATDTALVSRMAVGDRSAVALLYERHAEAMLSLARAVLRNDAEAEDLIQDVFLEAWRRSADYSEERGSVRVWLALRTRSRAFDRLKSRARPHGVPTDPDSEVSLPAESGDQARLRELLSQMPAAQREVLELGYFEGLSSAEIAARLEIPTGTVKSRTRAALQAPRSTLKAGND